MAEAPQPRQRRRAHSSARDLERYAGLFAERTTVMRSSPMRDLIVVCPQARDLREIRAAGLEEVFRVRYAGVDLDAVEDFDPARFLEELAHERYLIICRAFSMIRPACAHHVKTQRRVGYLDPNIHHPSRFLEDVEVLAECFPTEVEPF